MKALSYIASAIFVCYILNPVVIGQDKGSKTEHKYKERTFCSGENWGNGDKVSFKEAREFTVPATGGLNVDGGRNGGISVNGENRSDVLVRACVQAWGTSEEAAKSLASSVRIDTSSTIKANSSSDDNWSVSYQISVPRNTDLSLNAHNGGISIRSVDGAIEFETTNGGVSLGDLSGSVKGRTTNGGVNVELTGSTWKGPGLDVVTTNGGVKLSVPETYAANFETGTTNGGFKSDVPALTVQTEDKDGWTRSKKIRASMNGGGAPIRVVTTNGGIKIDARAN